MIGAHNQPEQLAQVRPGVTSAIELLGTRDMRVEITLITAANVGSGTVIAHVYHDDDGATYDATTMIIHKQIGAHDSEILFQAQHPGSGIPIRKDGTLGIELDGANDCTITVYGVTENIAVRGAR